MREEGERESEGRVKMALIQTLLTLSGQAWHFSTGNVKEDFQTNDICQKMQNPTRYESETNKKDIINKHTDIYEA